MAGRTLLPVISISRFTMVGFVVTVFGDVTNGNVTPNDGATFLGAFNNDTVVHNLTVQLASGVDGSTVNPKSYPIPVTPGPTQLIGPFPLQYYGSQLLWNVDNALIRVVAYSLLGP